MNLSFFRLPENATDRARNALLIILLYMVGTFATASYVIFQAIQNPSWQLWTTALLIASVFLACFVALFLNQRGRTEFGIWVLSSSGFIASLGTVASISGLGLLFFTILVSFNALIAVQTLQSRKAHLFIAGSIAGVIALFIDAFTPAERINVPVFQNMVYFFGPTIILILGYVVFRQFRNYPLSTKLIVVLVSMTVISITIIGFITNYLSSISINAQVGSNVSELSKQMASKIGDTLDTNIQVLAVLSLEKTLQDNVAASDDQGNVDLAELSRLDQLWINAPNNDPLVTSVVNNNLAEDLREFQAKFPTFVEVFTTDKLGRVTASANRTSDYYQADEDWWQSAWDNGKGKVYIGQVTFDESTQSYSIIIALPITAHNNQIPVGILRATIDVNEFSTFIQSFKIGETGRSDLLFQNNQTLTAETGLSTLSPEDVLAVAALPKTYGQITYKKSPALASIGFVSAPLSLYKDIIEQLGWRVIVHQDISEAQKGVVNATRSTLLVAVVLIIIAAGLAVYFAQIISSPITRLTQAAEKIAAGDLTAQARIETEDETGVLAKTFNAMTTQLRDLVNTLEARVAERTRNLELAAEVGRSVSQVRALNVMLKDAAELIRSRFDLYYVQVYLTNPAQTTLQLEAGTGEVGVQLLARQHSLSLNINSINGRAAVEKRSVVISDTTTSATFRPNPLLPETRSEMAVPLLIGDKVVGVLDLQSRDAGSLNKDDLSAFEALAGQLAIAIQNANLFAEAEQSRAEVEKQAQRLVRAGWQDYLDAIHQPEQIGFVFENNEITSNATEPEQPELVPGKEKLAAPITITGERLGSLVVAMEEEKRSAQSEQLIFAVARQVAQQIENLRLLDSANRYRVEAEEASRRLTREGWKTYTDSTRASLRYLYDLKEVRSLDNGTTMDDTTAIPLKVRDEVIGKIAIRGIDSNDTEALSLANDVAERLSTHIENLRLTENTQERAYREQSLRQITSAVRSSPDPEAILRTAVRELGALLGRKTIVRLATSSEVSDNQAKSQTPTEDIAATGDEPTPAAGASDVVGGEK